MSKHYYVVQNHSSHMLSIMHREKRYIIGFKNKLVGEHINDCIPQAPIMHLIPVVLDSNKLNTINLSIKKKSKTIAKKDPLVEVLPSHIIDAIPKERFTKFTNVYMIGTIIVSDIIDEDDEYIVAGGRLTNVVFDAHKAMHYLNLLNSDFVQ